MRTLAILFIMTFIFTISSTGNAFAEGTAKGDGAAIFKAQNCTMCHKDVGAGGGMGPDLKGVGKKHDEAWFTKFLKKEVDLNGKKHMGSFSGSDDELGALVTWLLKQ